MYKKPPYRSLRLEPLEQRTILATFTVTNLLDGPVTAAGQLPGSLRQAIFDANTNPGADEITFSSVSGTLTMTGGQFNVVDALSITGPGQGSLTINANRLSRIFSVGNLGQTFDVSLGGLTLTNGLVSGVADGGAVRSLSIGTLSLSDATISEMFHPQ